MKELGRARYCRAFAWLGQGKVRYNRIMERGKIPIQKRLLSDPEPALDPAIAAMTPAMRMALVYEATCRLLAMQGINLDEQRLQRHVVRVKRCEG